MQYFRGNYDTYEKVFAEERLNYERERSSIQAQIDHLMIFINRFRVNANRAPFSFSVSSYEQAGAEQAEGGEKAAGGNGRHSGNWRRPDASLPVCRRSYINVC